MGARAEVSQPAPGTLGADAEWCIAAGELQTDWQYWHCTGISVYHLYEVSPRP